MKRSIIYLVQREEIPLEGNGFTTFPEKAFQTPKEAKQKARQWHLYMTAPTDEMAQKYLNGEIVVK